MVFQVLDVVVFLLASIWFVLGISCVVIFHELGHFWAARSLGIGVHEFVVGFGRSMFSWNWRGTTFRICALPFGGYVKLMGSTATTFAALDQEAHAAAFYIRPTHQKVWVTLAGPLANLVLALAMFGCVAAVGLNATAPVLAAPDARSLAYQSGLRLGDRIEGFEVLSGRQIESDRIASYSDLTVLVKDWIINRSDVRLDVARPDGTRFHPQIDFSRVWLNQPDWRIFAQAGFPAPLNAPLVRSVRWGSPARAAGMEPGDLILAINGRPIVDAIELGRVMQEVPETAGSVTVSLERAGEPKELTVALRRTVVDSGFGMDRQARLGVGFYEAPPMVRLGGIGEGFTETFLQLCMQMGRYFSVSIKQAFVAGPSLSQMVDPFMIQNHAGRSHFHGLSAWFCYLGAVSVALALFNLLPLPTLDGARCLIFMCEGAAGQPFTRFWHAMFNRLFGFLFLAITYLAFANEVARAWAPKATLL